MPSQISRQILEQAADWFLDFRAADVPVAARRQFHRWLQLSPQHIEAYLEVARTYADLGPANGQLAHEAAALLARARLETNADVVPLQADGPPVRQEEPRRRRRLGLAVAASVLVLVVGILASLAWDSRGVYATQIGEERSLTLNDGSIVDLDANSRIRVRFTPTERAIDLIQGHALFDDTEDPHRPFKVFSRGIVIRALGTQFDVNREITETVVTVIEGRVTLSHDAFDRTNAVSGRPARMLRSVVGPVSDGRPVEENDAQQILLSAGEQVSVRLGAFTEIGAANLTETLAWQHRQLIFDSTPLIDVINEFNRYNRRPLIIESSALARLRIGGVYTSTDPTSFLRFLGAQPGISIEQTADEIRIVQSAKR